MAKRFKTTNRHIPKRAHHYTQASKLPKKATAPQMRAKRKTQRERIIMAVVIGLAVLGVIGIILAIVL